METETMQVRPAPSLRLADEWHRQQGEAFRLITHSSENSSTEVRLTQDELQAIVQAAYDQAGILATPSLAGEAARGLDLPQSSCTGTARCAASVHYFDCQATA